MKPTPKVFSRNSPCSKADIWRCFARDKGFAEVETTMAHTLIGLNAPRIMERNGYLVKTKLPQGDYYTLTDTGKAWLILGIIAYEKNHPEAAKHLRFLPGKEASNPRIRRVRIS